MTGHRSKRSFGFYVLVAAVVFQGLTGVAGGFGLVRDPTGASLGIPMAWLDGSPFRDYLVPGLVLLFGLGIAPLVVAYGLWRRHGWAWSGALCVGLALIGWLAVEIAVVGYVSDPPLQLAYGVVAALIVIPAFLPSVRRYLRG